MRVLLREIREKDIWILHRWINDPQIIQHTNTFRPISEMEQRQWLANTEYFQKNHVFGICLEQDDKLIGTCGLYDIDNVSRKAELRMKICETAYRGQGLGAESLKQLLDFGFKDANLHKIWLRVMADNEPAIKLYLNGGFQQEGVLRHDMFIKGEYQDLIVMSILKEEYV